MGNSIDKLSVCFGEVLLRLTTSDNKRFTQSDSLNMNVAGAECNVANNLSALGIPSKIITTPSNNLLGDFALNKLKQFDLNTQAINSNNQRMGSYYLKVGTPNLKSSIVYDRESSAFSWEHPNDYQWDELLSDADHFHVSGINLAISNNCADSTCEALKIAQEKELLVSFDCNYRPVLWRDRIEDAIRLTKCGLSYASIAFITDKDVHLTLGLPETTSSKLKNRLDAYAILFQYFPNLEMVASTFRTYDQNGQLRYQGILYDGKNHFLSNIYHIPFTIDRIGTGDAFAAGIIYGLKMRLENQYTIDFATALAIEKHSIKRDYAGVSNKIVLDAMQKEHSNVKS